MEKGDLYNHTEELHRVIAERNFKRTYTNENNREYKKIQREVFSHIWEKENHICQADGCGEVLVLEQKYLCDSTSFQRARERKYCKKHRWYRKVIK